MQRAIQREQQTTKIRGALIRNCILFGLVITAIAIQIVGFPGLKGEQNLRGATTEKEEFASMENGQETSEYPPRNIDDDDNYSSSEEEEEYDDDDDDYVIDSYEPKIERVDSSVLHDRYDVCVVGAGLSGAVIAERYATQLDKKVLVIEKRDHIGGNCFDFIDEKTGIRISKYGAHLFHTKYERVWEYVQQFSDWTKYEHEVIGFVNGTHVPIPVNIDTVNLLFDANIDNSKQMDEWLAKEQVKYDGEPKNSEEMAMSRVGKRLYEMIFKPYTFKQWAKWPSELGPEVTARIPVRNNFDGRYFDDPHQALPTNGYTAIFEKMLDHKNIKVTGQTDYFKEREFLNCGRIYFTGPVDAYFAHLGWDKLEYRSLDFERKVVKNVDYFQPAAVVNHPSSDVDFTRIVEYKHFLKQTSNHTVIFYERSKDDGEPYYPVPNKKNKDLFAKYKAMAEKEPNVTFVGRLANYKYFNMDQSILNALELFDKDTGAISSKEKPIK